MDLPTLRTIPFCMGVDPRWHRNGLAGTDGVLTYGHRVWRGQRDEGEPMLTRDRSLDSRTDKVKP